MPDKNLTNDHMFSDKNWKVEVQVENNYFPTRPK